MFQSLPFLAIVKSLEILGAQFILDNNLFDASFRLPLSFLLPIIFKQVSVNTSSSIVERNTNIFSYENKSTKAKFLFKLSSEEANTVDIVYDFAFAYFVSELAPLTVRVAVKISDGQLQNINYHSLVTLISQASNLDVALSSSPIGIFLSQSGVKRLKALRINCRSRSFVFKDYDSLEGLFLIDGKFEFKNQKVCLEKFYLVNCTIDSRDFVKVAAKKVLLKDSRSPVSYTAIGKSLNSLWCHSMEFKYPVANFPMLDILLLDNLDNLKTLKIHATRAPQNETLHLIMPLIYHPSLQSLILTNIAIEYLDQNLLQLPQLQIFDCSNCIIECHKPCVDSKLTILRFKNCKVTLTKQIIFHALKQLQLTQNNLNIDSIFCPKLESFDYGSHTDHFIDFEQILRFVSSEYKKNLMSLAVGRIRNLSQLNLNLQSLKLYSQPSDYSLDLTRFKNLEYLELCSEQAEMMPNLKGLNKLKEIELGYFKFKVLEGEMFRNMKSLRKLFIWGNTEFRIENLELLACFRNHVVKELPSTCSGLQIVDYGPTPFEKRSQRHEVNMRFYLHFDAAGYMPNWQVWKHSDRKRFDDEWTENEKVST